MEFCYLQYCELTSSIYGTCSYVIFTPVLFNKNVNTKLKDEYILIQITWKNKYYLNQIYANSSMCTEA